jgi:hypothetical protein
MTKLSSTLPGGDNNGLNGLARALITDPHKTALIVAVVDCKSITIDTDTGDKVATVRIRRVEPIDPEDTETAQRLLARGLERRTGAVMLPMELEDELSALFANLVDSVDLETGEVTLAAEPEPVVELAAAAPDEDDDIVTAFKPNPPKPARKTKLTAVPEPPPEVEDDGPPWPE